MTLAQIRTLALGYLDDSQSGYFDNAFMLSAINKAQREVQKLLIQQGDNWYLKAQQTPLIVNQQEYIMPADFRKSHRLEVITAGVAPNETKVQLAPISLNQQDMVPYGVGTPAVWAIKKDRIMIFPAPSVAYTMRLWYSYRIADLVNDSDIPDVAYEYHEFIAILAAIDGFVKDDRPFTNLKLMADSYEKLMRQDSDERQQDAPRHVIETESDNMGSLF